MASNIGLMAVVLNVVIPLALWLLLRRLWSPTTRRGYAFKFSLWPMIFFSSQLGGPVAREFVGLHSAYSMSLGEALKGVIGLSVLLAPVFFGIGYLLARRKFQVANNNQKNE